MVGLAIILLVSTVKTTDSLAHPPCSPDTVVGSVCMISILGLHPTQKAAGMREVQEKQRRIQAMTPDEREKKINESPAPSVIGPGGAFFITDRHHLALALFRAGILSMNARIDVRTTGLGIPSFWAHMRQMNWVYLFHLGQPIEPSALPADVRGLEDDPYRSLAHFVQKRGGFKKTEVRFAEFQWANYFRSRVRIANDSDAVFEAAVAAAIPLAHHPDARNLPGWRPDR